jgi:hypothetical protein
MISLSLFLRLPVDSLYFSAVFGLGFTLITPLTNVGIGHAPSSLLIGS